MGQIFFHPPRSKWPMRLAFSAAAGVVMSLGVYNWPDAPKEVTVEKAETKKPARYDPTIFAPTFEFKPAEPEIEQSVSVRSPATDICKSEEVVTSRKMYEEYQSANSEEVVKKSDALLRFHFYLRDDRLDPYIACEGSNRKEVLAANKVQQIQQARILADFIRTHPPGREVKEALTLLSLFSYEATRDYSKNDEYSLYKIDIPQIDKIRIFTDREMELYKARSEVVIGQESLNSLRQIYKVGDLSTDPSDFRRLWTDVREGAYGLRKIESPDLAFANMNSSEIENQYDVLLERMGTSRSEMQLFEFYFEQLLAFKTQRMLSYTPR